METIKELLSNPIVYLILIGTFLCVVLPWLKKKAEDTPTVIDDKIWTLVEMWAQVAATKAMKFFK